MRFIRIVLLILALAALILAFSFFQVTSSDLVNNPIFWTGVTIAALVAMMVQFRNKAKELYQLILATNGPARDPSDGNDRWKPRHPHSFYIRRWLFGSILAYGLVIIIGLLLGQEGSLDFRWLAIFASVAHFFTSLRSIPKNEVGAVFWFGKLLLERDSGLIFVPQWVGLTLPTTTKELVQVVVGTEAKDSKDNPAESRLLKSLTGTVFREKAPQRITYATALSAPGAYKEGEDPFPEFPLPDIDQIRERLITDPINRRVTTDPILLAAIRPRRAGAFFMNIGNMERLSAMIAHSSMGTFQESAGRIPVGIAQENQVTLQRRITRRIEQLVGERPYDTKKGEDGKEIELFYPDTGVDFVLLQIKDWGFPHDVNTAIAEASAAGFNKDRTIQDAEGEAESIKLKGKSTAVARKDFLLAEAEGAEAKRKMAEQPHGELVLQTEALTKAIATSRHTIISPDLNPVLGAAGLAVAELGGKNPQGSESKEKTKEVIEGNKAETSA